MKFVARHDGHDVEIEVQRYGSGYRVRLGDRWIEADMTEAGQFVHSLRLADGTQFSLTHHREENTHEITLAATTVKIEVIDPLSLKRSRREDEGGAAGAVKALMPGRVVRIMVQEGETVRKGTPLLILEAMKMENEIQAPCEGTVSRVLVSAGQTVEGGADLLHIG
ncbi:MAG TPA: biotin/lipoyl-containing protein [Thermoanaerobaculia bacterium]